MSEIPDSLIETLKQGQESVLISLEQTFMQARIFLKAQKGLGELQEKIIIHLNFQDKRVLPALEEFFAADRERSKKLEFLRYDEKEFKLQLLEFFDKYVDRSGDVAARNFPIAFARFRKIVIERIHTEEENLFPLIQEFLKSKSRERSIDPYPLERAKFSR